MLSACADQPIPLDNEATLALAPGPESGSRRTENHSEDLRTPCRRQRRSFVALDAGAETLAVVGRSELDVDDAEQDRVALARRPCPGRRGDRDAGTRADGGPVDASASRGALTIKSVTGGASCNGEAVQIRIDEDGQRFTAFANLTATAPEAVVCHLYADIEAPDGKTFAVTSLEVRGASSLPVGYLTQVMIAPGFVAQPEPLFEKQTDLVGPYDGKFVVRESFAESERYFRSCVTKLPLRLAVVLRSKRAVGDADPPDAVPIGRTTLTQVGPISFSVRDCPSAAP
jgi:hypothetical protein